MHAKKMQSLVPGCIQGKSKYLPRSCCPTAATVRPKHSTDKHAYRCLFHRALLCRQWDNSCEEDIYFFLVCIHSNLFQSRVMTIFFKQISSHFHTWSHCFFYHTRSTFGCGKNLKDAGLVCEFSYLFQLSQNIVNFEGWRKIGRIGV